MPAQKESIPDRASVHAKEDDFGTKKPRGKSKAATRRSLNRRVTYRIGVHTFAG